MESGTKDIFYAINQFQNDIGDNLLAIKHRREIEQIDEVMIEVPELPKNYTSWIIDKAYMNKRYVFYKDDKGYCTHCKKTSDLIRKVKHNSEGICASCHSKVMFKSYNKQKYVCDDKYVGIIQQMKDGSGYMYRVFRTVITYRKQFFYEQQMNCFEIERTLLSNNFYIVRQYIWGEYKNTGKNRWCCDISYATGYSRDSILYTRNLKRMLRTTELRYMDISKLVGICNYSHPTRILSELMRHKEYEMLIKVGLIRTTKSLIDGATTDWNYRDTRKFNKESSNICGYLGINKEYLKIAIKNDAKLREILVMRTLTEKKMRLDYEKIQFLALYIATRDLEMILNLGHVEKLIRYCKENLEIKQGNAHKMNDYIDYIKDLEYLNLDMSKNMIFPKNFESIHREISTQRREKEDDIEAASIVEKNKILKSMLPELRKIYFKETDNLIVVFPTSKKDFNKEGRDNHNCVGGAYFDSMIKGNKVVFFLRRKEDIKKAYCTVEFKGSRCVQCRTNYNKDADEEAKKFISELSEEVKKKLEKVEKTKGKKDMLCAV